MQNDKNTPIRPAAARSRGGLLNAALLSAVLVSAALLSGLFLGGCSSPLDAGANGGGGNVTLTFGKSDGRTITSGVDLPADVLASMRFEAKLSGPNREALTLNAKWGETTKLKLRQGKWRIDAKAYQADSPNLAGTGSISFDIKDRNNKIIVPMAMRDTAGAPLSCYEIHVPGFANGQVEASFTAAYPGTTVTLTTAPAGGYILHSLTYTDGTATHTPAGGGNEYTFTMPDADVTVSAVFIHPFYTITYSAGTGSGTVPAPVVIELGTSIPLPAGSAPSGGIPFHSWEMGGTVYTAGASYTVTGDVTLTARWAFSNASDITAYLSGSAANPIPLPAGLNLADSANGWNALFGVISSATPSGQYVALDLSISTISGTEFNPALSAATGKDKIVSLVLPDTALSIANGSSSNATFKDFTSLKRVSGDGLTGVGQYAFYYCTSLAEVSLPAAASIGEYAFQYCTSLAEVSLPAAASIGHMAFYSCTSLTEVSLPAVTTLGNYVFDSTGVTTLTITMGSTPPTVGAVSFYNVTVTKNVTVKVPSTALSLYDTTWQDDFKIGSSINLSIEPL